MSACAHNAANHLANFERRTQLQLTDAVGLHGARVAEKACGTPRSAITMQLRRCCFAPMRVTFVSSCHSRASRCFFSMRPRRLLTNKQKRCFSAFWRKNFLTRPYFASRTGWRRCGGAARASKWETENCFQLQICRRRPQLMLIQLQHHEAGSAPGRRRRCKLYSKSGAVAASSRRSPSTHLPCKTLHF